MRVCVLLIGVVLTATAACGHWQPTRRTDHESETVTEPGTGHGLGRTAATQPAASRPAISDRAGVDALQRWTQACFELGLRHDRIFAKGGRLLVRWQADRQGNLLYMDFVVDSFRGWAVNSAGETLADCVVSRARQVPVIWSVTGSAPFRLHAP